MATNGSMRATSKTRKVNFTNKNSIAAISKSNGQPKTVTVHVDPYTRTVNGKAVQVAGYTCTRVYK